MRKSISQILIEKMQEEKGRRLQTLTKVKNENKKLYMYQNITTFDVILPHATDSGRKIVGAREKFIGDEEYKSITEFMCLHEILPDPKKVAEKLLLEQKTATVVLEQKQHKGEAIVATEKEKILLTEIPETYKEEGKVEYVMRQDKEQMLQEDADTVEAKKKRLLKEANIQGVKFFK